MSPPESVLVRASSGRPKPVVTFGQLTLEEADIGPLSDDLHGDAVTCDAVATHGRSEPRGHLHLGHATSTLKKPRGATPVVVMFRASPSSVWRNTLSGATTMP